MDIEIILTVLIITLAFFGEAIFGFGGGLVSIPLLSLLIGVREGVTLVLIFQTLTGLLLISSRRYIAWNAATPMAGSLLVGAVLGTFLLSSASIVFLQVLLAATILLFLAKTIWYSRLTLDRYGKKGALAAGLGGGLFQGTIGIGGPILIMYLSGMLKQKASLRATLIYLLFITCFVRIAVSIPQGLFTSELIRPALITLPFFLIAIFYGQRLHEKISDTYYRMGVYVILAGSAATLLLKAIL